MMHSLTIPFPFFHPTRLFFYGLKPTPQIPSIIKHQDQQCRSPKHFLPSHSSLAPALRCSTPRAKPATRKSHHHFPHARCGYFFCLCLFFTKTIIRKLFTYSLRLFFHRDLFLPPKMDNLLLPKMDFFFNHQKLFLTPENALFFYPQKWTFL